MAPGQFSKLQLLSGLKGSCQTEGSSTSTKPVYQHSDHVCVALEKRQTGKKIIVHNFALSHIMSSFHLKHEAFSVRLCEGKCQNIAQRIERASSVSTQEFLGLTCLRQ